jgi:hypothetical protein
MKLTIAVALPFGLGSCAAPQPTGACCCLVHFLFDGISGMVLRSAKTSLEHALQDLEPEGGDKSYVPNGLTRPMEGPWDAQSIRMPTTRERTLEAGIFTWTTQTLHDVERPQRWMEEVSLSRTRHGQDQVRLVWKDVSRQQDA